MRPGTLLAGAAVAAALCGPLAADERDVPAGCRGGVTLLCADPAWPDAATPAGPARTLTAGVGPADPLAAPPAPDAPTAP